MIFPGGKAAKLYLKEYLRYVVVVPVGNKRGYAKKQHPPGKGGKRYNLYVLCSVSTSVQNDKVNQ